MTKIKNMKKQSTNNKILPGLLVILVFISGVFFLVSTQRGATPRIGSGGQAQENVNYGPPTEEEQAAGDLQKIENVSNPKVVQSDIAQVAIVDASQYENTIEVRAFISNVLQDGTCVIGFTNNNLHFEKSVPAYADASTTPCVGLEVPLGEFNASGSWSVTVSYTSSDSKSTGSSTAGLEISK